MSNRQWAAPSQSRQVSTCETSVYPKIEANATQALDSPLRDMLPVTLTATPEQQAHAMYVASERNRSNWNRRASSDLGSHDLNMKADYYGALSEIVLYDRMEASGLSPIYTLISPEGAVKLPDFLLDGVSFEIKSSPPGKSYLCINHNQHHDKLRQCDFYICAFYQSEVRIQYMPMVTHSQITTWQCRKKRSEYYSISRCELAASLNLFPTPAEAERKSGTK